MGKIFLQNDKLLQTYLLQPRLAGLGLDGRMSAFGAACNDGD